jgi:uroporphyrinogen-III synthase
LVTRPTHQAAGLSSLIEAHQGRAVAFPALDILPAQDPAHAKSNLQAEVDILIFVSPNAVAYGLQLLNGDLPSRIRLGAVGKGTAMALQKAGYAVDLLPAERFDSEGLLALPELQHVKDRRVVIVRGEGGRPLLADRLRERGAEVDYAEVYTRARPTMDPGPLLAHWERDVQLVTTTSIDVLINLQQILGRRGWPLLRQTPLLVISQRMQEMAEELGFQNILRAQSAGDEAILARLCEWMAGRDQSRVE